jgi:hypothetical protein
VQPEGAGEGSVAAILTALSSVAADGATMSLFVRNGLAPTMRDGLRGQWDAAIEAFDTGEYTNRLGLPAHARTPAEIDRVLIPLGWNPERWFGVRIFTDHRDEPAPSGRAARSVLTAEHDAGSRDPYRSVAALLHLVYTKPLGLMRST